VGAGLSGIGAGYHLQANCPRKTYAILEGRAAIGGTWDLFRYPGIRSDSDMYTLGYAFKPWREAKAIADGPSILNYVRETAAETASTSTSAIATRSSAPLVVETATWTVEVERRQRDGEGHLQFPVDVQRLLQLRGRLHARLPGVESFRAGSSIRSSGPRTRLRRQAGRGDRQRRHRRDPGAGDGQDRRPRHHAAALADLCGLAPGRGPIANWLRAKLPAMTAYGITRWKNVLMQMLFFNIARKKPEKTKAAADLGLVREHLGPDYDVETHFTPRYNPWDQRLCLVPDADLFDSLKDGTASVVTDQIETFTDRPEAEVGRHAGRRRHRHRHRPAHAAAGRHGGGGRRPEGRRSARDHQLQGHDVQRRAEPGLDLRLHQRQLDAEGRPDGRVCLQAAQPHGPHGPDLHAALDEAGEMEIEPWLDFSSGYVQRALEKSCPSRAPRSPWKVHQNYALDLVALPGTSSSAYRRQCSR
jgi:monooxygenase